ncbi:hypothetical protein CMO83_02265 [Candidatus Woesearchaeota archaeon]|nr:hypothetical protein [Candidatus Woesearchaeota archaeon]|tara:strand:- start:9149 stop:10723 length:1575 start_codon:yes stop_codon:yes gene_type:complete
MKKIISITIMLMFILSLVPLSIAEESSGDSTNARPTKQAVKKAATGTDHSTNARPTKQAVKKAADKREDVRDTKEDVRDALNVDRRNCIKRCEVAGQQNCEAKCRVADKKEDVRDKKEDRRDRHEDRKERNKERFAKFKHLDKNQVDRLSHLREAHVEKFAQLNKERLDKVAKLNKDKIKRLGRLNKERLDKVSDLSHEELKKFSTLNRAKLKKLAEENPDKIKEELRKVHIKKIRNAEDLRDRNLTDQQKDQLRTRYDEAKKKYGVAKDELHNARDRLKAARQSGDEEGALEHAKAYLLRAADSLINHLEKIKAKIEENENIDEEKAKMIVERINIQIDEINQIKADIEAATTKEEIKEAARKLRNKWKNLKHLIRLYSHRVLAARVEGLVHRGQVLEKKLEHVLAKADEKSIDVDVSDLVDQFSAKIDEAKETYRKAHDLLSEALELRASDADREKIKALVDEAKDLLKQARDAIKEAHDILKDIVKIIRGAYHDADFSTDVEVEVVDNVDDSTATTPDTAT